MIETGRYNAHNRYIRPEDRICRQCDKNSAEDEFHFINIYLWLQVGAWPEADLKLC